MLMLQLPRVRSCVAAVVTVVVIAAGSLRGAEPDVSATHPGRNGALTPRELAMAKTAWAYFDDNYQPGTGLVNAASGFPSTTMWDTASYLGALVSAKELGLITAELFDQRVTKLLNTLKALPFFNDELPNKAYDTRTITKVNYDNRQGEVGFSALDLGRLLVWLKIVKERYPAYADAVDRFVLRWNVCNVIDSDGNMRGATVTKGGARTFSYLQEGRLGYEEYAAKGFQLWGFDTAGASRHEPYGMTSIFGVDVPHDRRDSRWLGAHNYVVSENYVLDGLEFNWDLGSDRSKDDSVQSDAVGRDFAERVYRVQEARFARTGILTARTEHQLDRAPYFVYDTIFTDGHPWLTIADDGTTHPEAAAVALKSAIGLWTLWNTPYTDRLFTMVSGLSNPHKGFFEGVYEDGRGTIKTFTANSNGVILESLLYKQQGKLLRFGSSTSATLWDREGASASRCAVTTSRVRDDVRSKTR